MSKERGWAAVNLKMTDRVARVEFDADRHWELVNAVTGSSVTPESPDAERAKASRVFRKAWNYDFTPGSMLHVNELEKCRTNMGHAVYEAGAVDFKPQLTEAFTDPDVALRFDPWETFGAKDHKTLVARFNEHYRQTCEDNPDTVCTTGTYITLLTGYIYIFGWEMLLTVAGQDAHGFGELLNRYRTWMQQYYNALAECDAPIIASHDDIVWTEGAIFPPEFYRKYIFPNLRELYAPLVAAGKKVLFLSDGNYTEFIDDIAGTGASGFFMEPLTDMRQVAERHGKTHFFIGNADTRVLLRGHRAEIRAEVQRCMDIGKRYPGFFMGVTNMIPYNTPVDAALYYNQCVEEMSRR